MLFQTPRDPTAKNQNESLNQYTMYRELVVIRIHNSNRLEYGCLELEIVRIGISKSDMRVPAHARTSNIRCIF